MTSYILIAAAILCISFFYILWQSSFDKGVIGSAFLVIVCIAVIWYQREQIQENNLVSVQESNQKFEEEVNGLNDKNTELQKSFNEKEKEINQLKEQIVKIEAEKENAVNTAIKETESKWQNKLDEAVADGKAEIELIESNVLVEDSTLNETPTLIDDPFGPDRDCSDFSSQAEAQAFYEAAGGPAVDPHDLDRDDGTACDSLN